MKKNFILALAAIMLMSALCACGSGGAAETAATADMQGVYDAVLATADMPEMVVVPADKGLDFFGIQPADCKQSITAICQNSLRADEVWLIEAADADAAARILSLADARLQQKGAESESYSPEQYKIIQNAQVINQGNYIAVLVSPNVDALAAIVNEAFGVK